MRATFYVALVLTAVAGAESSNLRPFGARRQAASLLATPKKVVPRPAAPPKAQVAAVHAPVAAAPTVVAHPVAPAAEAVGVPAAVQHLNDELEEVKQARANVLQVQKTLKADVALLRESNQLWRTAKSAKSRKDAQDQVKDSEKLVKDTEAMVKRSRQRARDVAQDALQEATEVQKAASALSAEANLQLKLMASPKKAVAVAPKPKVTAPKPQYHAPKRSSIEQSSARGEDEEEGPHDDVDDVAM